MDSQEPEGAEEGGAGRPSAALGDRLARSPEALPPFSVRAPRIARAMAEACAMPLGLVDAGGTAGPIVHAACEADAEAAALAWRAPGTRRVTLTETAAGLTVAVPAIVGGRDAWIAAIDPTGTAPTPKPAFLALLAELAGDAAAQRDATVLWVRRIETENRQMARAQEFVGIGTLTYDYAFDALELSPTAAALLALPGADTLEEVVQAFDPYDRPFVSRTFEATDPDATVFDFERQVDAGGESVRWLRVAGEVVYRYGAPAFLFATLQDVTAERVTVDAMRDLAEQDPLTGLFNRTVFDGALADAIEKSEAQRLYVGLLILDIDGFKEINDTVGSHAGDEVLRYVARALTSHVRATDTVLRLAGDEFAVVLPLVTDTEGLLVLARRIEETLRAPLLVGGQRVNLSTSIGLAVYPDDVSARVDVYKAADYALFEAKSQGGGRVTRFQPAMRERRELHRAFIASVRDGLSRGEFTAFFQPKVDLGSGTVVGFEALCRWLHPERGILGPGAFLQAFDDREVGGALSDTALHTSFEAVGAFKAASLPFGHIAVNLNALQLERAGLLAAIEELQERHDVTADEITFEVVENVLIRDRRVVYDNLMGLHHAGFRVALDDFGTGYASLTHIREPFIREVKIDRSFITNSRRSPHDQQIVAAIVQMARRMGLTLVAEGIEDEETIEQLRAIGCTVGQGFVFSGALPLDEAMAFIGRQNRIFSLLGQVGEPAE
jgi:diguanylate cyclase (GGDEF)-like protein